MSDTNVKYPLDKIRNIGIIAHIDAGKTTSTETILYYTGRTHKIGKIDDGSTQMDWMAQERERGITIQSAATTCFWTPRTSAERGSFRINIIDTPGHVDFTAEVERSLRVLDGAVVIFDGKMGVEPQSETVWRQADKYGVPRICFINKLNLVGGDFYKSLDSIRERLNPRAVPIALPLGFEYGLKGYIDLVTQKAYQYKDESGLELEEVGVPEDMKEKVSKYRMELVEASVEKSDRFLDKFLNDGVLTEEELKQAIREATLSGDFFPVLGGDGRKAGVLPILDAVVDYLPSPKDIPSIKGFSADTGEEITVTADPEEPFAALAFKIQTDPYVGRLTYFRVYSGTLKAGSYVLNTSSGAKERIGRMLLMHANHREEISDISAGEIGATVGLKKTSTGDTLCDESRPVILESISFPEPVISVAVEPKTKLDQEKLGSALQNLSEEDPTFTVRTDEETGQTIISGMGELHLEIIVDRMKREFGVEASVGKPQVAYRETIRRTVEQEGKYIHQSGGRGQYGHVWLRLEPQDRGCGVEFVNEIKGGAIPREYIPAIEKGCRETLANGVVFGYPMIDLRVVVYDGSYHDVDSSEAAFKVASSRAIKEGVRRANPVLLEPIMKVDVQVPEDYLGDVIGDLSSRRGQISGTLQKGTLHTVSATVPLADMFGYATTLRSLTQGRGSFNMEPSHYEEVPENIAAEVTGKEVANG